MRVIIFIISTLVSFNVLCSTVKFGIHEFPPFVSNTLNQKGLLGYYVRHIFKKEGIQISMNSYRRGILLQEVLPKGDTFAVFPVLNTGNFDESVYSKPLIMAKYVFIYRKGLDVEGINFRELSGLKKLKIGALVSTKPHKSLKSLTELNVTSFTSSKELIAKFKNRSFDVIAFERTSWTYYSKLNRLDSLDSYVLSPGPWGEEAVYALVSKKYPDYKKYLKILNEGIGKYDLNKMIKDHFY